ncbi:hypothetical protein FPZ11_05870 [Humibacter ginsenosidimutans]|uniref:Uncharacterized protein n=1 Tax=Humibacter ginsenosidimutans TaxID=2599293 RepID=A0A5B8M3Q4_9MICO|nr:hypothetical protein FPZ11_05870 [Humibacter ginsenosidimutans]
MNRVRSPTDRAVGVHADARARVHGLARPQAGIHQARRHRGNLCGEQRRFGMPFPTHELRGDRGPRGIGIGAVQ